jgi:hypothetical protein
MEMMLSRFPDWDVFGGDANTPSIKSRTALIQFSRYFQLERMNLGIPAVVRYSCHPKHSD